MYPALTIGLTLFGSPAITRDEGVMITGGATQRHRLALLALLALSRGQGLSRDKLMGYLWPERDTDHARQLLNQAVYTLRKALGEEAIVSASDRLRLDPRLVRCDVVEFEDALAAGNMGRAVRLYSGPFLDGYFLSGAPEFERWAEAERQRLAARYAKALEALAEAAEKEGDFGAAVDWWRVSAVQDPYSSRIALRLMRALEVNGERAGALQHAAAHQRLLQEEFGAEPDPEVDALVERLRTVPDGRSETGPVAGEHAPLAAAPTTGPSHSVREPFPPTFRDSSAGSLRPSGRSPPQPDAARAPAMSWRPRRGLSVAVALLAVGALVFGSNRWGAFGGGVPPPGAAGTSLARPLADARSAGVPPVDGAADTTLRRQPIQNVAAFELYRRGDDPALLRSDSTARVGLELFQQAVALDPTYAAAWAGIARMYVRLSGPAPVSERPRYLALAEEAANRAVALDAFLAEAHAVLGTIRMSTFDFASAEQHLRHAIELDPTRAVIHEWTVTLYLWTEQPEEALAHARRALEIDPLSPSAHAELARALLASDRCDEAFVHLDRLAALQPPLLRAPPIAAQCYARQEMWSDAIAVLRPHVERAGPTALAQLGYMLARDGQREEARGIQAALLERWRSGEGGAFDVALVHAGLEDLDEAFDWFDRSLADRSLNGGPGPNHSMIMGPLFESLHDDPRFERLRERLGLPKG